ncbi:hypothetical protein E2320_018506 [Naja naja]|nr:hypothetical protein E2320_018506 [Naja naja]
MVITAFKRASFLRSFNPVPKGTTLFEDEALEKSALRHIRRTDRRDERLFRRQSEGGLQPEATFKILKP